MPELPDLKVYSENLKKLMFGKHVYDAQVFNESRINAEVHEFVAGIKTAYVTDIYPEGKELFIKFDNKNVIAIHLMLNGKCFYENKADSSKIQDKIIALFFDGDFCFVVSDFQSYCKISFNPEKNTVPDVLSSEFTLEYFLNQADKFKRKKIKAFLLDQKILRGIGNAYADEILWKAKISPKSITGKIPQSSLEILFISIKSVMLWAISQIKQINPETINGEERKFMRVHNPRLKFTKDREKIHIETISSKKTYYTDSQVHYY